MITLALTTIMGLQTATALEPSSMDGMTVGDHVSLDGDAPERAERRLRLRAGPDIQAVYGGQPVGDGDWPDAGAVYSEYDGVFCTAVLIAPQVALTAAHCVDDRIDYVAFDTNDYYYNSDDSNWHQVVYQQPYSTPWYGSYDIAVLIFAEPVEDVEPRVIARDCVLDDHLDEGAAVNVVGFGTIDRNGEQGTTKLLEGTTYVQYPECDDPWKGCNMNISPGGEIGAGGNNVDACTGDSGGPLYLEGDDDDYLVGITSRAYSDVSYYCGEGGIYTRPDAVVEWVESVAAERLGDEHFLLPRPDECNEPPRVEEPPQRHVQEGRTDRFRLDIDDEDTRNHEIEILEGPEEGEAWVEGDQIYYRAPVGELGGDDFLVRVHDEDAEYPATPVDVEIDINVVSRKALPPMKTMGSCSTAGGPGAGWLGLFLLPLLVRRRR